MQAYLGHGRRLDRCQLFASARPGNDNPLRPGHAQPSRTRLFTAARHHAPAQARAPRHPGVGLWEGRATSKRPLQWIERVSADLPLLAVQFHVIVLLL
jgi:hypothetical protein